ncbi:uncharacterized protein LOC111616005 [Centruroides sculpturatus]|uniref:uncharacterized protein LOC111616005 n=1 Tax=Centruroides sculpturatus TaxID=218467 RepID=UPI000C6E6219|nr:uncharacterized protein LOC111616005 [Centruroides sculpturatus]
MDKQGNILIEKKQIAQRWKEYIEKLYKGDKLDESLIEEEKLVDANDLGPSTLKCEFDKTLKGMRKGKAPGADQIPVELIMALGENTKNDLYRLINEMYITGQVPKDFEKIIMVLIPKKKGAQKCEDHRTLSLVSHISKILCGIIYRKIERKVEENLSEDQFGFT